MAGLVASSGRQAAGAAVAFQADVSRPRPPRPRRQRRPPFQRGRPSIKVRRGQISGRHAVLLVLVEIIPKS